jgi:hypothetical protein
MHPPPPTTHQEIRMPYFVSPPNRRLPRTALPAFAFAAAMLSSSALAAVLQPYNVLVKSYPNSTAAVITWDADAPAVSGFGVERRLPNGSWSQIGYVSDATHSAPDGGLANGTQYEYRVVA